MPTKRACPRCYSVIEITDNCKHSHCVCMGPKKYSFCFVCLALAPQDGSGNFPCGRGGFQYCGKVAPTQTFDDILKK